MQYTVVCPSAKSIQVDYGQLNKTGIGSAQCPQRVASIGVF